MAVVGGIAVPHPPIILPEVGRGEEWKIEATIRAYREAARTIADMRPDTIIITSPHTVLYAEYFHVSPGKSAKGNLEQFRVRGVSVETKYDEAFAKELEKLAHEEGFPAGTDGERDPSLDHGTLIPLRFLQEAGLSGIPVVRVGLSGLDAELTPRGFVAVDPVSRMSSIPGLFAAGDIASGPGLLTSAIGSGRETALAVHRFLSGFAADSSLDVWLGDEGRLETAERKALPAPHVVELDEIMHVDYHEHAPRVAVSHGRESGRGPQLAFAELEGGLCAEDAAKEAARCLHCGHCISCGSCVESCPGHILEMGGDGPFVAWPEQCWHCGCCRIACSTGSVSYRFPLTMML